MTTAPFVARHLTGPYPHVALALLALGFVRDWNAGTVAGRCRSCDHDGLALMRFRRSRPGRPEQRRTLARCPSCGYTREV